jgi:hypothetical protein
MPFFKKELLAKVLSGEKTETRRVHKQEWKVGKTYAVRDTWFSKPQGYIIILRKFRQRLAEISDVDIKKEGFRTKDEFFNAWKRIYGKIDENEVLVVYEFKVVKTG